MTQETKLYAYKQFVSDSKTFCFDEHGTRYGETPNLVFDADTPEKAEHIVKCVNSHDALVEALKFYANPFDDSYNELDFGKKARQALAAAGEKVGE